jgi:hypothetical protein
LEDDQIFLHIGEKEYADMLGSGLNPSQAYYMPSPADAYVLGLRKWIGSFGGGGPFGPVGQEQYIKQLPARLGREHLLDR